MGLPSPTRFFTMPKSAPPISLVPPANNSPFPFPRFKVPHSFPVPIYIFSYRSFFFPSCVASLFSLVFSIPSGSIANTVQTFFYPAGNAPFFPLLYFGGKRVPSFFHNPKGHIKAFVFPVRVRLWIPFGGRTFSFGTCVSLLWPANPLDNLRYFVIKSIWLLLTSL